MAEVQPPQLLQQRDAVWDRGSLGGRRHSRLQLLAGQRMSKWERRLLALARCCAGAGGGAGRPTAEQRAGREAAAGAAASDAQRPQPAAALQAVPQGGQLGCAGAPLDGEFHQGRQAGQHLRTGAGAAGGAGREHELEAALQLQCCCDAATAGSRGPPWSCPRASQPACPHPRAHLLPGQRRHRFRQAVCELQARQLRRREQATGGLAWMRGASRPCQPACLQPGTLAHLLHVAQRHCKVLRNVAAAHNLQRLQRRQAGGLELPGLQRQLRTNAQLAQLGALPHCGGGERATGRGP